MATFTLRAAMDRINRRIRPRGQLLVRSRGEHVIADRGTYHTIRPGSRILLRRHVDIYELGVNVGAFRRENQINALHK